MAIYKDGSGQFDLMKSAEEGNAKRHEDSMNGVQNVRQENIEDNSQDAGNYHVTVGELMDKKERGEESSIRGAGLARGIAKDKASRERWKDSLDAIKVKNQLQRGGSGVIKAGNLVKGTNGYLKNALNKNKES